MPASPAAFPLAAADQCVKCGLCLPHCPSYGVSAHEGDSPRGRIALMQGLATGALPNSPRLQAHLDGCLGCRACETVCPAQVPYGQIIDAGRALVAQQRPPRRAAWVGAVLARRPLRTLLRCLLRLYQWLPLPQALVRRVRLLSLLPPRPHYRATPASATTPARHRIQLFQGCTGSLLDAQTLHDARALLRACGAQIEHESSRCCGALQTHAGLAAQGAALMRRAQAAHPGETPVLSFASGCGAHLHEAQPTAFAARVQDIHHWLCAHWPADARLRPLPLRVALHRPCSHQQVLGGVEDVRTLLRRIPQIELVELDASARCCGAAGHHLLAHPGIADAHLPDKLARVRQLAPDLIVSSNVGCALHLAGGLRRAGLTRPRVLHPVSLLWAQWDG